MPKIIPLKQGTKEWKQWRRYRVCASDMPIIMGISPWKTERKLWEEKIFDLEFAPNAAMERGSKMEAKALQWYCNEMFIKGSVAYPNFEPVVLQHEELEWAGASLDGYRHFFSGAAALEIKCPGIEAHMEAIAGRVPAYYIPQVQWIMFVAGLDEMIYLSFDGVEGIYFQVKRNQDYILNSLLPAASRFYQSIIDFNPPEPTDRDTIEIFDPIAKEMANRYIALHAESARIERELMEIKLKLEPKDNIGRVKVNGLSITKVIKKGYIDWGKIPELRDVDLEKYRKEPFTTWRFTSPRDKSA